jgi:D-sedoheptulose 7-phosphate isomerase
MTKINPIALLLKRNFEKSFETNQQFLQDMASHETLTQAIEVVIAPYQNWGRLYIAVIRGSAADAQYLVAEFVSKLTRDRAPLAAEALTVDSTVLTAIGNDHGYEHVFSRQLQGKVTPKDCFLAISTSGNSANIINALATCKKLKIPTILFFGHDGGKAIEISDYTILAPGNTTCTI